MGSMLDRALWNVGKGFFVFPLVKNSKTPLIKSWGEKASTDIDHIKAWWSKWPNANIGIATGPSGLCVVDVDMKPGKPDGNKSLALLELENGDLPGSFSVTTATGLGRHIYFKADFAKTTAGVLGASLDTRGQGGFVVAAGSKIDGKIYKPINKLSVCDAPAWIIAGLGVKSKPKTTGSDGSEDTRGTILSVKEYLKRAPLAIEGEGGDATTYSVCCDVRDLGVTQPFALELLLNHWNERCDPPWDFDDLEAKVQNAYLYGQNNSGSYSIEHCFGHPLPEVPVEKAQKNKLMTHGEVVKMKPPAWLVKHMFTQNGLSVVYGAPNCGKSFFVIDLALRVANGLPWFNDEPLVKGASVYVAGEGLGGLPNRIKAWDSLNDGETTAPFFTYREAVDLMSVKQVKDFVTLIKEGIEGPIKFIVIDTVARCMTGDENSTKDMGLLIKACDYIRAQTGAHVCLVHHSGKDKALGIRGSSALNGAVDTALLIEKEVQGKMTVRMKKQKDAEFMGSKDLSLHGVDVGIDEDGARVFTPAIKLYEGAGSEGVEKSLAEERILGYLSEKKDPLSILKISNYMWKNFKEEMDLPEEEYKPWIKKLLEDLAADEKRPIKKDHNGKYRYDHY